MCGKAYRSSGRACSFPTLLAEVSLPRHVSSPLAIRSPLISCIRTSNFPIKGARRQIVAFVHLILAFDPVSRLFVPFSCTFAINEGLRGELAEISCTFALNRSNVPQTNLSRFTYCRNNTPCIQPPTTLPRTYFAYSTVTNNTSSTVPSPTILRLQHRYQQYFAYSTVTNKSSPTYSCQQYFVYITVTSLPHPPPQCRSEPMSGTYYRASSSQRRSSVSFLENGVISWQCANSG